MQSHRGKHIASFLQGGWRAHPPALHHGMASFTPILPHLVKTGAGGLAWWKVRAQEQTDPAAVKELEQVYRVHRCEAFMHEIRLKQVVDLLRIYGVEPILSKGWAVARHYPEAGLRPYCDFDIHVDPCRLADAARALASDSQVCPWVDLHAGVPELSDRPYAELYRRSQKIDLGDTVIRILGAEDQLRHLCLHFARHGGWRPLWLCDVAAFLETADTAFDWDYCLGGDDCLTAWVRAVLGLAVRILDARPAAHFDSASSRAGQEESWLDQELLNEWSRTDPGDSHTRDDRAMASYFWKPWRAWHGIRSRVPNAIEAAFRTRSSPQVHAGSYWRKLSYCCSRAIRFTKRIPSLWQEVPGHVQIHQDE